MCMWISLNCFWNSVKTILTVVLVPSYQLNGINLIESNYRWIFHCALVFSRLSLTRHNDDILGRKHPLRWGGHLKSIYTPPKLVATPLIIWHPPFPKCWIKPCVMCVVVVGAVLRVFHMLCVTCDCVYSQHCLHSFYHANIELVSHILCSSVAANLL